MRQIASHVGVQAGALYNYTPDKQTLLFDLMRQHMEELLDAWQDTVRPTDTPLERLNAFTRFHIRFNTARPEAVFISYMELRNLKPENYEKISMLRRRYETELEAILAEGVQTGVFALTEPRLTAMAIIAMLTGVNTWFQPGGRLSLEEVEVTYWNMVRPLVSAPAPSERAT